MGPFSKAKVHKTHYISVTKYEYEKKNTLCHGELSAFFSGVTVFFAFYFYL